MHKHKPSLVTHAMYRQVLATVLSLIVVLFVLMLSVDHFMLNMAASELHEAQLEQPISLLAPVMNGSGMPGGRGEPMRGGGGGRGAGWQMRGGAILLGSRGQIIASKVPIRFSQGYVQSSTPWALTKEALQNKQMHGVGRLPWVNADVVWSSASDGQQIDVRWKRVDMVRTNARGYYIFVILAVLASSMFSLVFSIFGAKKIASAVQSVAQQSSKMADGQFDVVVSPQPAKELQQLADSLNDLARGLDQTIQELQSEHQRLERLENAQRMFVADASHELRAPLSSLNITLSAWEEGMLQPDEQQQAVTIMHREIQRLARIVSSMLDLSRIDSGQYPLVLTSVDIHSVVSNAISNFPVDGAPIHTEFTEPLPMVSACADGLHRILVNILDNARRFTPADGSIILAAEKVGQFVAITITDTGCGIQEELAARIWQRFTRGSKNRSCPDEGVGLGLSIVRGLTEAMGGSISLQSQEGIGTKITVNIPVFNEFPNNA